MNKQKLTGEFEIDPDGSGNEIFKIISGQVLGVAVPAVLPDRQKNLLNVVHNVCDFVVFVASVRVNLKFAR